MAFVQAPAVAEGDSIVNVDPSTKLWPDYKAEGDEYALITMHTIPFEGSVGLINQLQFMRFHDVALDFIICNLVGVPFFCAAGFDYDLHIFRKLGRKQLVDVFSRETVLALQIRAAHIDVDRAARIGIISRLSGSFCRVSLHADICSSWCIAV